jgi:pSer/pThr/pTyr-binding forkhead associated (FHA) protein
MSGVILLILRTLLVVALYTFLGWSLLNIWRDLKHQNEIIAARQAPSIEVRVREGDSAQTYQYKGSDIMIGRDPACECTLNSEKVSVNHARLSFHHNQWWIEDLNSTNGSFLNSESVTIPTVVADGDQLRCGDILMTIVLEEYLGRGDDDGR